MVGEQPESVTHADSTGLQALDDLAAVADTIGRERFFPSVSAAVEAFRTQQGAGSGTRSA